ncbi:MAG TPA: hypothetical protein VL551_14155 [Actinospica sp.]|jgi:hypothetical protein|nr:hypothetical protein [Actinospica sp.]
MPTSDLERLFALLGDPPTHVTPTPWELALPEAGLRFPTDYRAIIDRYGSFELHRYLTVRGPSLRRPQIDMPNGFPGFAEFSQLEAENALLPENSMTEPTPDEALITGPADLLCWGGNIAGDRLFWLTIGEPDDWPIMIWFCGSWTLVHSSLAKFLADTITWALPEEHCVIPIQGPENPDWWPGAEIPPLLTCIGDWATP